MFHLYLPAALADLPPSRPLIYGCDRRYCSGPIWRIQSVTPTKKLVETCPCKIVKDTATCNSIPIQTLPALIPFHLISFNPQRTLEEALALSFPVLKYPPFDSSAKRRGRDGSMKLWASQQLQMELSCVQITGNGRSLNSVNLYTPAPFFLIVVDEQRNQYQYLILTITQCVSREFDGLR